MFLILEIMRDLLEEIENKNNAVFRIKLLMKNCGKHFQHQNTKNRTVILIFQGYSTYILICCVINLNI